jgi:hypothetical protein
MSTTITPAQSQKIRQLNVQLTEHIRSLIQETENIEQLFEPATVTWMSEVLADSVLRRVTKFRKGQKEHGGDFLTKRFPVVGSMEEEHDDLFWYFEKHKHDISKLKPTYDKSNLS